jgi:hypothetical protein
VGCPGALNTYALASIKVFSRSVIMGILFLHCTFGKTTKHKSQAKITISWSPRKILQSPNWNGQLLDVVIPNYSF